MTIRRPAHEADPASPFGAQSSLDAPYAGPAADGFGGRGDPSTGRDTGPVRDGFGGGATGTAGRDEPQRAAQSSAAPGGSAATPAPAIHLATPPAIDFGEVVVGEHPTESRPIYNVHPTHSASVQVSLSGDADFALMAAPERLRPSREGSDAPVVVRYLPTKRAESKATLKIHAAWQQGVWPATDVEVPVVGKAHGHGEKTHAEEDADHARADERGRADGAAKARDGALKEAVASDNKIKVDYPKGAENQLDDQHGRADRALREVAGNQRAGIHTVAEQAATFQRKLPHVDHGLLFTLAMFGLDMAIAGLAGAVAKRVATALGKTTTGPAVPRLERGRVVPPGQYDKPAVYRAPEELVAFVADGLKQGMKDAGRAGRQAATGHAKDHDAEGDPDAPWISFFSEQTEALNGSERERGNALDLARTRLRPLLRSDPDQAWAAMAAIADGLEEAAGMASARQADESRFAWMRFLSQSALGSLTGDDATKLGLDAPADGETITDVRGATAPPREGASMERFDGVLNLEFEADGDPTVPVRVVRATMTGVTPAMAAHLGDRALSELGVVIRAHGRVPGMANLPITVVRDEIGNVQFSDETGNEGAASSWLSRKAAAPTDSPERRRLGARKLMEEVMATQLVSTIKPDDSAITVKTDHAGGKQR